MKCLSSPTKLETMHHERQMVERILKGDESVLREFYRHYQPRLLTYISHKVASVNDAEEILQDVLLATIEGLRDFSFRCRLFTYICSIANHKVIDYYRRKKIKNIVFSKLADVEPFLATMFGPEEVLDEELFRSKINLTFARLSPKHRIILQLKYIYGYSVEEIAKRLSISFKSAESLLFRARRAFVLEYSL